MTPPPCIPLYIQYNTNNEYINPFSFTEKRRALIKRSLIDIYPNLDNTFSFPNKQIERITKLIKKATIIYIFADGINEQIGHEFKYMMARIGKAVEIATDNFWVALNCLSESANPLAIYVNHREHNVQLLEKIRLL